MKFDIELLRDLMIYLSHSGENMDIYMYVSYRRSVVLDGRLDFQDMLRDYLIYLGENGILKPAMQGKWLAQLDNSKGRYFLDVIHSDEEWEHIKDFGKEKGIEDFVRLIMRWEDYSMSTKQKEQVNTCLDMILKALGANAQTQHRDNARMNELIEEFKEIIQHKDQNGIKTWLEDHGLEGIATLASVLQLFIK